jgi:hypothetical protein
MGKNIFYKHEYQFNVAGDDLSIITEFIDDGDDEPSSDDASTRLQGNTMTFGEALEVLKRGYKVARQGWNGKGMFLYLRDFSDKRNTAPFLANSLSHVL